MLFNSIFGGGAPPPTPYFSRRKCDDKLEFFQNKLGLMCGPATDPLQKVGQRGGYTSKIQNWVPKNRSVANFKRLVLRAQKELCAQISGANRLGIKVLFFWCLLYATCKLFWSKTLIGLLERCSAMGLDFTQRSFCSFALCAALRTD